MRFTTLCIFIFSLVASVGCGDAPLGGDGLYRDNPMVIEYSVNSADTGALRLVNTYYAKEMRYMVFDEQKMMTERVLENGEVTLWFEGDRLFMRETAGDYCTCAELTGQLLGKWLDAGGSSTFTYDEERVDYNGWQAYEGYAVNENNDTVKVLINDELPNAWFDQAGFPGLPMEFAYNLRDQPVVYSVEDIAPYKGSYDPDGYDDRCVRIPAPLYAGADPEEEVEVEGNKLWVYGYLMDEDMNVKTGEVTVQRAGTDGAESGTMGIDYGSFDIELLPGEKYMLDFTAPGMTHKRIEIDASRTPKEGYGFNFDINVMLFDNDNVELNEYLQETTVSSATYQAEIDNFAFDTLYEAAVAREIERMRKDRP